MEVNQVALGLTLGIAAFTDWRDHRIYNKLLVPAFFTAILLRTAHFGISGLWNSLFGAAVGFSLLLLPYFMGGIGAGDVKLLAVIGAFGGVRFVLTSFFYGAIFGALISVYLLARRGALGKTLKHFLIVFPIMRNYSDFSTTTKTARQEKFPYGIAIVIGTLIAFFLPLGGGWL